MPNRAAGATPAPINTPRSRRGGDGRVSTVSVHRWAAGTASSPAYGFTSQSSREPAAIARARATPAPGSVGSRSSGSGLAASQRARTSASTIATATPASTPSAAPSRGSTSGGTGAGGGAGVAPTSARNWARASAARNGATQAATQRSQRNTSTCRRRARAKASKDATSTGSSSVPASSEITQPA